MPKGDEDRQVKYCMVEIYKTGIEKAFYIPLIDPIHNSKTLLCSY